MRLIEAMPRLAAVPSTVAMMADSTATSTDTHSAWRMDAFVNRLRYHLKVKPVNSE